MTIGMNNLGRNGRLGNQMFQYASLVGIAKQCGFDFRIPADCDLPDGFEMLHCGDRYGLIEGDEVELHESHEFCEELFNQCPNHVTLNGYFQTEKYFKNVEEEIRQDFTFRNEIAVLCKHKMSEVDTPVGLHIRRGDFLINSANHHNLGLDYYESALKHFNDDRNVIIFSDDPEWCKEQKLFEDDRFLVSEGNDSYTDLCLMSLCSDFIIANSSFSWWGAWLSKGVDKVVCAPSIWFGPNNAHLDTSDIIPDEWTIVK